MQLHIFLNNDQQYPQNLILSVIHQLLLKNSKITSIPSSLLPQIQLQLQNQFQINSIHTLTEKEILTSICAIYNLRLHFYKSHHRYTYYSTINLDTGQTKNSNVNDFISCQSILEIYCENDLYHSVLKSEIREDFEILSNAQRMLRSKFKLSTWNLRGVTCDEDQTIIDYLLKQEKIDVAAIQESHLNCSKIETSYFIWMLGPQYQSRASRGVGFLISKRFYAQNIINMTVVTPNLVYLTIEMPYVKKISIINIHKLTNNDPNSSLETGI